MKRELKEFGFTQYEIKIYVALLEYGRMDAKQISEKSKVPPTAVYPNLKSLIDKQIIQKLEGEISLFEAVKPSIALRSLAENKRKHLIELENALIEQTESIVNKKQIIPQREVMKVYTGRETSSRIYEDAWKKAKKTYYVIGWKLYRVKDKFTYLHEIKKMLKKGVDVKIISVGKKEKAWEVIRAYLDAGVEMRYVTFASSSNLSLLIVDEEECKITLKSKDLPERINIHIQDPSLSKAMQFYFKETWKKAYEFE